MARCCALPGRSTGRARDALDPEPVLQITRHAAADLERVRQAAQVHEVLAAGIARNALQVFRVHQRVAVNAHEVRRELLFQRLAASLR